MKVNKKALNLFILAIAVVFVLSACAKILPDKFTNRSSDSNPTVKGSNTSPGGTVAILDSNIVINQPISNASISSPVEISGRARVFEGLVLFRVRDFFNQLIAEGSVETGMGASEWGPYRTTLEFPQPVSPTGWVEVYTQSANDKNGSDQDLIRLPVAFAAYQDPVVGIFYSNINQDPELLNCDQVYPAQRIVQFNGQQLLINVLEMLFSGVTEEEMAQGFVNNLPEEGVRVQSLDLAEGGILKIDFNQALQEDISGSCRVQAIQAQIVKTLIQFSGIEKIEISIDGETEGILQP